MRRCLLDLSHQEPGGARVAEPHLPKSVTPVFGNYFPILKGPAQIGPGLRIIGGLERDRGFSLRSSAGLVFLDNRIWMADSVSKDSAVPARGGREKAAPCRWCAEQPECSAHLDPGLSFSPGLPRQASAGLLLKPELIHSDRIKTHRSREMRNVAVWIYWGKEAGWQDIGACTFPSDEISGTLPLGDPGHVDPGPLLRAPVMVA